MAVRFFFKAAVIACLTASGAMAQPTWQEALAAMPLTNATTELNRTNCVRLMLGSFQRNPTVKALIFMPGATDEFYFFHRARAALTNASPTLLDAVIALTNQTYVRATFHAPFLLMHTAEDPLEPLAVIEDPATAARITRKKFEKHGVFNDRDWDYMHPILSFDLDTKMIPGVDSHESNHFFRHSFAEFDLNGWEALEAVALAGKTTFTVQKRKVIFDLDKRFLAKPPTPSDFLRR